MDTKVKGSNVKLGEVLYLVCESNLSAGVQRVVVTTLALDSNDKIVFHINNDNYPFYNRRNYYITRSEKKAQTVYQTWLDENKRRNGRYNQEQINYNENKSRLDEVSKSYIGKTVMVRFRRRHQDTAYEKVVISNLYATYNKDEFKFETKPSTNFYLTTREGKNWHFWTEVDELESKKQTLLKQLEAIESKLKEVKGKTND